MGRNGAEEEPDPLPCSLRTGGHAIEKLWRSRRPYLANGLSHADRGELLRWLSGLIVAPKHLFVVHGEANVAEQFGEFLREKTGWKVSVPEYRAEALLE